MLRTLLAVACALTALPAYAADPKPLKILFLGDFGHHQPALRYRQLAPVMAARKIDLVYTDKVEALNPKTLASYDGLVVYANIDNISPDQAQALLDYVDSGKGFIPLHCASFCFRNSAKVVELIGGQFQRHGTGVFRVTPAVKDHPITKGFSGFESWDETYVHTKHNEKDRIVLEYREDKEGKEPWTWVRTHGKGRVFYTAWGHDERTWAHDGFNNLVERGIRWACGDDPASVPEFHDAPKMVGPSKDVRPFEFVPAKVPFYPAGERWGTTAEPIGRMQKPLPPEESVKYYQHPAGMEMKLFASEPHFGGKPIAMNWDERGRLWVCATIDYPNEMQPKGRGRDKIVVCEDTDGDGVADKYTTFADNLSIPTSLAFAYGGIVVHQAPDTLFLKDTDGDGKADVRKVLFTGWGTGDTHAGPSNLRYGPDGWYYGMVGYSAFSGTVGGESHRFGQGLYRFQLTKADNGDVSATKMEFLRGVNNNAWGVGFSEDGLLFGSTANGCPSVYLAIPNRYYERVRGWSSSVLQSIALSNRVHPIAENVRQVDWHGGFTAAAGHALYTARNYPKEYWNRTAFVMEPTGHLAATMVLQKHGTDFQARYGWNLVAGVDEWHAPIMAEVGPDGNMWVLDWYNFIVQHNPTPVGFKTGRGNAYETELRDKKHGRVYRLVPKDLRSTPVDLSKASDIQLVAALRHPNMGWRLHAQRLLTEKRATGTAGDLVRLVQDQGVDEIGLNVGAMHALWTLASFGGLEYKTGSVGEAITAGMRHPSAAVQRAAVSSVARVDGATRLLRFDDFRSHGDPHVRLATFLAMADAPPNAAMGEALARSLTDPDNLRDRWIPDALTAAAATHDIGFLSHVARQPSPPRAMQILAIVAEHTARRAPQEGIGEILASLATPSPATAEVVVAAFAKGWPKGKKPTLTAETEKAMTGLLAKLPGGSKGQLVKLASAWGSNAFEKYAGEIAQSLFTEVADVKRSDDSRVAAAKQLTEFRPIDGKAVEAILEAITPRASPALVNGLIEAVGASNAPEAATGLTQRYGGWSPGAKSAALRILLAKPDSTRAFLDSVEKGSASLSDLALDQKQALASHPDAAIATRAKALLAKGGGLPNADRQKVIEELHSIIMKTGDATAGKVMFTKHCAACHQHSGEGTRIGPDLTGMAVHPKEELLIHILDPSRSVEGNFRLYQVVLTNDKVLSGMLASETKTTIELIDAQAKRHVVLREEIDTLTPTTKSLMPEGFEKQMNVKELTDLLEFLTKRGKYLPLPLDKAATIVSTKGMFFAETDPPGFRLADWKPRTVEGVPFVLVDPLGDRVPNLIMLRSPNGAVAAKMPKSALVQVNSPAKAVHMLTGMGGWAFPFLPKGSVSMKVRLHYDDGKTEDHDLKNGEHFADYIRKVEVPGSKYAFPVHGHQVRYLAVFPKRENTIKQIEFLKGSDDTAPIVMAVTVEGK